MGNVGVNNVQIKWGNGYGKWLTTYTDENGCFEIVDPDPYKVYEAAGKEKIVVKFKNDQSTIRALRQFFPLIQFSQAVDDKRKVYDNYNDIHIVYDVDDINNNGLEKLYYHSAHANNAVQEFHAYCDNLNLPHPAQDLDFLLTSEEEGAAAPMLDDMANDILTAILGFNGCAIVSFLTGNGHLGIANGILCSYLSVFAPDIVDNYGDEVTIEGGGFFNTDRKKNTYYQELGHAQHFEANGSGSYWRDNIYYVIDNELTNNSSPYGNRGDNGHERCGIIETWGFHQGFTIAHSQYGSQTSLSLGNGATLIDHEHIYQLETYRPDAFATFPKGFEYIPDNDDAWIPKGLLHDCFDDNSNNPTSITDPITDNLIGFSHLELLNSILGSPTDFSTVEDNLESVIPSGQSINDLNTIFNDYGY